MLMQRAARAVLVLLLLALSGSPAWANTVAAVLRSVTGTVFAQPAGGQPRLVTVGTELKVGDTVGTQKGAFALLVFADGSRVALRPESAMIIRGYSYKADDPANDQMSVQLLKGWLRNVSGQIGKRGNDAAYQLQVNDTTIGIRGTDFAVRLCDEACAAETETVPEGVLPQSGRLGQVLATAQPLARSREGVAAGEASVSSAIFLGEHVVTGETEAVLGLDDGTRVVMGPGTELALRAEEDARGRRVVRLDLLRGALRLATPPQPGARLYGLLVNAGELVGMRQNATLDVSCARPARSAGYACDESAVLLRSGQSDVLSTTALRSLRAGQPVRLLDPAGAADGAPAVPQGGTQPASPSMPAPSSGRWDSPTEIACASQSDVFLQLEPVSVWPRWAPPQEDAVVARTVLEARLVPVQLSPGGAPSMPNVRGLFDPADLPVDAVRPPISTQRPAAGIYAAVFEGVITMGNPSGRIFIPASQGGFAPVLGTAAPPRVLPAAPRFMETDRELQRPRLFPGQCVR